MAARPERPIALRPPVRVTREDLSGPVRGEERRVPGCAVRPWPPTAGVVGPGTRRMSDGWGSPEPAAEPRGAATGTSDTALIPSRCSGVTPRVWGPRIAAREARLFAGAPLLGAAADVSDRSEARAATSTNAAAPDLATTVAGLPQPPISRGSAPGGVRTTVVQRGGPGAESSRQSTRSVHRFASVMLGPPVALPTGRSDRINRFTRSIDSRRGPLSPRRSKRT